MWDRVTGWARRRFDEWVHHRLDQLLPEPQLALTQLPNVPVRRTGEELSAPPPVKRRRRLSTSDSVVPSTPPNIAVPRDAPPSVHETRSSTRKRRRPPARPLDLDGDDLPLPTLPEDMHEWNRGVVRGHATANPDNQTM